MLVVNFSDSFRIVDSAEVVYTFTRNRFTGADHRKCGIGNYLTDMSECLQQCVQAFAPESLTYE